MKFFLKTVTIIIISGLIGANAYLYREVIALKSDIQILKQGHNQTVLNTKNIEVLAEFINPNINSPSEIPAAPVSEASPVAPNASSSVSSILP